MKNNGTFPHLQKKSPSNLTSQTIAYITTEKALSKEYYPSLTHTTSRTTNGLIPQGYVGSLISRSDPNKKNLIKTNEVIFIISSWSEFLEV